MYAKKGEQLLVDQFLESNLWNMLLSKVSLTLKSNLNYDNLDTESLQQINENDVEYVNWAMISPNGYLHLLEIASKMLAMSTQNCVAFILKDDCIMFDTLSCMLSERFLSSIKKRWNSLQSFNVFSIENSVTSSKLKLNQDATDSNIANEKLNGELIVGKIVVDISQILCFPFSIDANEEIIAQANKILNELNLFNKILSACTANLNCAKCDIPISLVSRLILTDENFLLLMIEQLSNSSKVFIKF